MRKQTKLEKRRKTILGTVLGLGAIALLTTATATYIISVSNTTQNPNVGVTVDTVSGDFVELTMASGTGLAITLSETGATIDEDTHAVGWDGTNTGNLKITLPTLTINYGSGYLTDDENDLRLVFSLGYADGANAANLVASDGNKLGSKRSSETATQDGKWTYVDLATTTQDLTPAGTATNGTYTVTVQNQEVSFKWGTFFGGSSPATFYNDLYYKADDSGSALDGEATDSREALTVTAAQNIAAEMDAMYKALNGEDLVLTVKVEKYGAGA